MKNLLVCCFAALCVVLTGCAGKQQREESPKTPEQENGQTEERTRPAEPEDAAADQFTGTWRDSGQYYMEIGCEDGERYTIEINSCSGENTVWQLTGTYDEIWEGIAYVGTKYEDILQSSGDIQRRPVPEREEITGLIYFEDDGTLHWTDDFDHTGDDLCFEKE